MRAFIGISLPDTVRSSLANLQRRMGESGADVKWVEPDHLHVTLKFLDEITDEQRRRVEVLLGRVASGASSFTLAMDRVGAFPSLTAPRVLWVGLEQGKEAVIRIAEAIEREGRAIPLRREDLPAAPPGLSAVPRPAQAGVAQAGRPFAAHVTLGRVRTPRNRQALVQSLQASTWEPPEPFQVTALTLYRSDLHPSGPRYTALAVFPLSDEKRNQ